MGTLCYCVGGIRRGLRPPCVSGGVGWDPFAFLVEFQHGLRLNAFLEFLPTVGLWPVGESTFWWIDFSLRALWWIEFSLRALWWIMPPERFQEHALPRIWRQ